MTERDVLKKILDGWYQPPEDKFADRGRRFIYEAVDILQDFVKQTEDAAYAKGFAEAVEKAAKIADQGERDMGEGIATWIARNIRTLRPSGSGEAK